MLLLLLVGGAPLAILVLIAPAPLELFFAFGRAEKRSSIFHVAPFSFFPRSICVRKRCANGAPAG